MVSLSNHEAGATVSNRWIFPRDPAKLALVSEDGRIQKREIERFERILGLFGSEHAGERAAAALAANAFIVKHQLSWRDVIEGKALGPKAAAAARRREVGIDYLEAAESRERQLKAHNAALEKQIGQLKEKLEAARTKTAV